MCLPAVGCVGVLGNLGAILILLRPEMKSTFHHTLITLAVVDILFVITLIIDLQRFDLDLSNQVFILFFPYFWNPLKNILMTFETFLMMSITTERYLAVRNPLAYRLGLVRYSSTLHLAVYILPALVLSVILNIPKFFETELVTVNMIDERGVNVPMIDYNITDLRKDTDYIFYYIHWTRFLATGFLPFVYLFLLNFLLVRHIVRKSKNTVQEGANGIRLRKSSGQVGKEVSTLNSTSSSTSNSTSNSSLILLVVIVIVYLVCNIPRQVVIIMIKIILTSPGWCSTWPST